MILPKNTKTHDSGIRDLVGSTKSEQRGVPKAITRPTGDQEVAGLIPAGVPGFGNILSWRLIMKYFLIYVNSFVFLST